VSSSAHHCPKDNSRKDASAPSLATSRGQGEPDSQGGWNIDIPEMECPLADGDRGNRLQGCRRGEPENRSAREGEH
jgi:hypothetical protein